MALTKQLTTSIIQTTERSCLMISYNIIMNYYCPFSSDNLFNYFLHQKIDLINQYIIDKNQFTLLSPEQQYDKLYTVVGQFNNDCIEKTLKPVATAFNVETSIVDIENEISKLTYLLINQEACLSLSCKTHNPNRTKVHWHTTPIAYTAEFHTIYNGEYKSLGQDFIKGIKVLFDSAEIGNGILFQKN